MNKYAIIVLLVYISFLCSCVRDIDTDKPSIVEDLRGWTIFEEMASQDNDDTEMRLFRRVKNSGGHLESYNEDYISAVIDTSGKAIVPFDRNYLQIGYFKNGIAACIDEETRKTYYIGTSGNVLHGPYDEGSAYRNGRAFIFDYLAGTTKEIDRSGAVLREIVEGEERELYRLTPFIYSVVKYPFETMKVQYQGHDVEVELMNPFLEDLAYQPVKEGNKEFTNCWFCIDGRGNVKSVVKAGKVMFVKNGYAPVITKRKWGFIDTCGRFIVEPKYKNVGYFSEGVAFVMDENDNRSYINTSEEVVLNLSKNLRRIDLFNPNIIEECGGGLIVDYVDKDGVLKFGYRNMKGEVVIPFEYDFALPFQEGLATVMKSREKNAE